MSRVEFNRNLLSPRPKRKFRGLGRCYGRHIGTHGPSGFNCHRCMYSCSVPRDVPEGTISVDSSWKFGKELYFQSAGHTWCTRLNAKWVTLHKWKA